MAAPDKKPSTRWLAGIGKGVVRMILALVFAVKKTIATIWRLLGALDSALWQGTRLGLRAIWRGLGIGMQAIASGIRGFFGWLPTRVGRAYSAICGVVLVLSALWIFDEIRSSAIEAARSGNASGMKKPPLDNDDPILARMGPRYIHLSDVIASARAAGRIEPDETLTPQSAYATGLVDRFVEQRLLAQAALRTNVQRDPAVARKLEAARERILAAAYMEARIAENVTPQAIESLYQAQSDLTRLGDEVSARHIVVATKTEAETLLATLKAGADFAKLARAQSLDNTTARYGGNIGYFTKDMMSRPISRAAFSVKPGQYAPLFKTKLGWHVLKVVDRRPTAAVTFHQVKDKIEDFLAMRVMDEVIGELAIDEKVIFYRPTPMPVTPNLRLGGSSPPSQETAQHTPTP